MDEAKYLEAFSGRLMAFGFGSMVLRGITLTSAWTGDLRPKYRRLNEWLRHELPDLSDDAAAIAHRHAIIVNAAKESPSKWTYPLPDEWRVPAKRMTE